MALSMEETSSLINGLLRISSHRIERTGVRSLMTSMALPFWFAVRHHAEGGS